MHISIVLDHDEAFLASLIRDEAIRTITSFPEHKSMTVKGIRSCAFDMENVGWSFSCFWITSKCSLRYVSKPSINKLTFDGNESVILLGPNPFRLFRQLHKSLPDPETIEYDSNEEFGWWHKAIG